MSVPMRSLARCHDPQALVPGSAEQIRQAAWQLRERADSCDRVGLDVKGTDLTSAWEGRAAQAAEVKVREMARTYRDITDAHSRAAKALEGYAHALDHAQSQAAHAVEQWLAGEAATARAESAHARAVERQAQQLRSPAGGGGRGMSRSVAVPVGYTPQAIPFVDTGAPLREEAEAVLAHAREQLASSGRSATASVEAAAALLPTRSVWAGLSAPSSAGDARATGASSSTFRPSANPQDNLDWWNSLTLEEQRTLIEAFPERIGNLDGIPAAVRDEANRSAIERDERMLREELEYYTAVANGDPIPAHLKYWNYHYTEADTAAAPAKVAAIEKKLDLIAKLNEAIDRDDRALLIYEPASVPPRAAVAVGDVDTADHVAVLVPGTGANVTGDIGTMGEQAESLREAAIRQLNGAGTVAVVSWIDYAAPTSLPWALLPHSYRAGSAELVSFTRGLNVTHVDSRGNPADMHLTVGGHSYGGSVAGKAAEQAGSGIDDVILYGAPGAGGSPAAGVGRFSMLNGSDPIHAYHALYAVGRQTPHHGVVPYDWVDLQSTVRNGRPTITETDGWNQIPTEKSVTPDGEELAGTSMHDYLEGGSRAEYNFAAVLTGQPENTAWDDPLP